MSNGRVSVIGHIGRIPVVVVPDLHDREALYAFEWNVFDQGDSWNCFVRRCLSFEICLLHPCPEKEFYFLIKRTSARTCVRIVFSRPAGKTFGSDDEAYCSELLQTIAAMAPDVASFRQEVPYA